MKTRTNLTRIVAIGATAAIGWLIAPPVARAHCDTMDGPVVATAKVALEKGDVTPVLKWVKQQDEAEIRAAFQRALAVRGKGAETKELADYYFYETLVRIHRAGEGAPYRGLKAAGTEVDPVVAEADKAIDRGSVDRLSGEVADAVTAGIKKRFARVLETKKHADDSVEAGRAYVEAYVDYVHYVERLHTQAAGTGAPHDASETGPADGPHAH